MQQAPLMTVEAMNERIRNALFNRWLGVKVVDATRGSVELHADWREEMFGNPDTGAVHGGVLAALVDVAASYGVAAATGRIGATLDMRVDYHRAAKPGQLVACADVVKSGRTINTVDVRLSDVSGNVVCSGRAVYFLAPAK
jgi:uncharacterized protein (TIGR00369 family)